MKKFYVNSLGDILTGEEHVLLRHHTDTELFSHPESALSSRLDLISEKIETLKLFRNRLKKMLDDPTARTTILIDEDNRWTQI